MQRFQHILLVDEPSSDQAAVLDRAVSIAHNNQAKVTVLHVEQSPKLGVFTKSIGSDEVEVRIRRLEESRLAEWLENLDTDVDVTIQFGVPFVEVILASQRMACDLILKVAETDPDHPGRLGATDRHLLRKSPVPVWILRDKSAPQIRKIVAAVDFNPWHGDLDEKGLNRTILELAGSVAMSESAELTIVHAWQSLSDRTLQVFSSDLSEGEVQRNLDDERIQRESDLRTLTHRMQKWLGKDAYSYLSPRTVALRGDPRKVIPGFCKNIGADLVVMGTISRTGVAGFIIGNTAESILNAISCAILAVKPDGFETPVSLAR